MEEFGLLIIFWCGILFAFNPRYITAIAGFFTSKNRSKTILVTILFALGHGIALFVFAKIFKNYYISEKILEYKYTTSLVIILLIGLYLLLINKNFFNSKKNLRRVFTTASVILVGSNVLFAKEPMFFTHSHPHSDIITQQNNISNVDQLLQSKQKSDMTYKQMMQRMGKAYEMMQSGVINQNKELVRIGASMIQNHPAPNHKPWTIVKDSDKISFKQTLLSYDKMLHSSAHDIEESLLSDNWAVINEKVYNMSNHCVSCHYLWKNNLK